jgi:predicted transcriptional regulator
MGASNKSIGEYIYIYMRVHEEEIGGLFLCIVNQLVCNTGTWVQEFVFF